MAKDKTIIVTSNVQRCLEILKETPKYVPEGDLRERIEAALDYLSRTFEGERQPKIIISCPVTKLVVE